LPLRTDLQEVALPGGFVGRWSKLSGRAPCRADAAKISGMTDHSLRAALKKPHVKRFYLSELEVLKKTSERARNVFALVDVRDNSQNSMARVAAAKAIEGLADDPIAGSGNVPLVPGLVIQIINGSQSAAIDVTRSPDPPPELNRDTL
jgi:hypothetical protein